MLNETDLKVIVEKCIKWDLCSQEILYRNYYGFAMSICLRYSSNRFDARNIVNEGFLKIFNNLRKYEHSKSFKAWAGKIMANTAIDHYRQEMKHMHLLELDEATELPETANILAKLEYEDLVELVQKLTPAYRAVFNLFAIDGYTHEEISKQLQISIGTSKSNLFKARKHLQFMIKEMINAEQKICTIEKPFTDLRVLKTS